MRNRLKKLIVFNKLNVLSVFRKRTVLIALEVMAALILLFAVTVGFLFWRLTSAPLDVGFARGLIENAVAAQGQGLRVNMDRIVLSWPEMQGPLLIGLKNARIYGAEGNLIVSVDEAGVGLSKSRLLIGQFSPVALILKKPALRVVRLKDNSLDIGLAKEGPLMGPPVQSEIQHDPLKKIINILSDPASRENSPPLLASLKKFQIVEAQLIVDDQVADMSWTVPRVNLTFMRTDGGLSATSEIFLTNATAQAPAFKAEATLDSKSGSLTISSVLEYFEPKFLGNKIPELSFLRGIDGRLNAQFSMKMDAQHKILSADLTALCETGLLNIPEFSAKPVAFSQLGLAARYDGEEQILTLDRAQLSLNENVTITANSELHASAGSFEGPVRMEIERLEQKDLGPLWPEHLKEEPAYEWAVQKISKGAFTNVYAQLDLKRFETSGGFITQVDNVVAGFDFEGMDINYRAPLAPITAAKGSGVFDLKKETLDVKVVSGNLLDMQIPKGDVMLRDIIGKGRGKAEISIQIAGPLKSALEYVQVEPIAVNTEIDIPASQGMAELDVNLKMPTRKDLKMEDVQISVKGVAREVSLPKVVKDLTLTGGPFNIAVAENKLNVKGKGFLEGQVADIEYEEFLESEGKPFSSKVKASLNASPELRSKMGIDLSMFLEGDTPVVVDYTSLPDKTAEADVRVDIGPSKIFIDPFDYVKNPGLAGSMAFKAHFVQGELKDIKDLTGSSQGLTLEKTSLAFRKAAEITELAGGEISRFSLGETVAGAKFTIAPNGFLKIIMDGPFLDLRPFLNNAEEKDKPYNAPPMQISVSVDRMRTADEEQVQYARIYAYIDDQGRFNQLELDGLAGKGDIYLRFKPDESGKRTFRMEADDAGATLKAFGIYKNIIGGKLVIYGEPIQGVYDRSLKGQAQLSNFKVVKAPTLARLLGLMSLTAVNQLLSNEGLTFSKLESRFEWNYRPGGSLLVLKDGRTSGNSLGLTFDGTFDNAEGVIDVEGTIIPVSEVNKIIGSIPLVGDIITGGTGSLIAATYSMKGKGQDVKTFVNPLSVLAPGILRRILFENTSSSAKDKSK